MSVIAVEGVIRNGVVRLTGEAALPDGTRVYVIVPDVAAAQSASGESLDREDLAEFQMTMIE